MAANSCLEMTALAAFRYVPPFDAVLLWFILQHNLGHSCMHHICSCTRVHQTVAVNLIDWKVDRLTFEDPEGDARFRRVGR